MGDCIIRVRIDLLLRLIDTTTGASVNVANVEFSKGGVILKPEYKGDGYFIFINCGRENGLMHIKAFGYEEADITIDYEQLNEHSPESDVFLIPSESTARGEPVIGITGNLPSLKSIDAINLMRPLCSFSEFNAKKNELSVFGYVAGKNVKLEDTYYGLTSLDESTYESFAVASQSGDNKAILKEPLQGEIRPNQKIYRMLFGSVKKDGSFIFRVRDDATEIRYLLRLRTKRGATYFRVIDFHKTYGVIDLMEEAKKAVVKKPVEDKKTETEKAKRTEEVKT